MNLKQMTRRIIGRDYDGFLSSQARATASGPGPDGNDSKLEPGMTESRYIKRCACRPSAARQSEQVTDSESLLPTN